MIDPGRLRHRVTIERQVTTVNEFGEQETGWVPAGSVWASVEPLSAREFIRAQQMQSQVSARIVMRYRPDLDASMRLIHRGTVYNIAGVLPDKDSGLEYVTLPVSAGLNDG